MATKAELWLHSRKITLEESFTSALKRHAEDYCARNNLRLLSEAYEAIGVTKQTISWWTCHDISAQTKKN
jgi:hypothetical protein